MRFSAGLGWARGVVSVCVLFSVLSWGAGAEPASDEERAEQKKEAERLNAEGVKLHGKGDAVGALRLLEKALKMREALYPTQEFPKGHPDLADSLNNMGSVLGSLGRPKAALPYYERALTMRAALYPQKAFPEGHPDLAESLNNMG